MKIIWAARSRADLSAIAEYIANDDPRAAQQLVDGLVDSAETTLSDHPNAGRQGRVDGTREWVAHKNYVVAYRVRDEHIQILSVMHSARLWPGKL